MLRVMLRQVRLWAEARGLNNPQEGSFGDWALAQMVRQPCCALPPPTRAQACYCLAACGARGSGPSFSCISAVQVIFSLQTIQPTPLLPPLWRLCAPAWHTEPPALRPLQPQHMTTLSSGGLAQMLEAARQRCSTPHALGMDAAAAADVSLLQAFMWFLALHDALCQRWQLSWNRCGMDGRGNVCAR